MKFFLAVPMVLALLASSAAQAEEVKESDVIKFSVSAELAKNAPASCSDGEVFIARAAVHSSSSRFVCGYGHEERARQLAEESALSRCFTEGYEQCRVQMSFIEQTGYLGYVDGFDGPLGYGCLAKAIVRSVY